MGVVGNNCYYDGLDGVNKDINEIYNHSYSFHIEDEDYFGKEKNYRIKEIFMQNSQGLTISFFLFYYRHFFFLYVTFFQQFRVISHL